MAIFFRANMSKIRKLHKATFFDFTTFRNQDALSNCVDGLHCSCPDTEFSLLCKLPINRLTNLKFDICPFFFKRTGAEIHRKHKKLSET